MSAPPILEPSFSTVLIASSTWTLLWSSGLPLEGVQTYGNTPGALILDGGQPGTAGGRGIDSGRRVLMCDILIMISSCVHDELMISA
jgi:hypothetical protein